MSEYAYTVRYSKTVRTESRISCETGAGDVIAKDEDEVRQVMAEEAPGWSIDEIKKHDEWCDCASCGEAACPDGEPLHFHHDGCPACDA